MSLATSTKTGLLGGEVTRRVNQEGGLDGEGLPAKHDKKGAGADPQCDGMGQGHAIAE